ncbi:MAG: hypothetical protein PWR03_1633 [Tenuifilum sp.]|jgi:hypothetical protein|nr:hypothetical protein [Tenuifilum sp.]
MAGFKKNQKDYTASNTNLFQNLQVRTFIKVMLEKAQSQQLNAICADLFTTKGKLVHTFLQANTNIAGKLTKNIIRFSLYPFINFGTNFIQLVLNILKNTIFG